jgi:hypothetical protein
MIKDKLDTYLPALRSEAKNGLPAVGGLFVGTYLFLMNI